MVLAALREGAESCSLPHSFHSPRLGCRVVSTAGITRLTWNCTPEQALLNPKLRRAAPHPPRRSSPPDPCCSSTSPVAAGVCSVVFAFLLCRLSRTNVKAGKELPTPHVSPHRSRAIPYRTLDFLRCCCFFFPLLLGIQELGSGSS